MRQIRFGIVFLAAISLPVNAEENATTSQPQDNIATHEEAVAKYTKLLDSRLLSPDDTAVVHNNRGNAYIEMGNSQNVEFELQQFANALTDYQTSLDSKRLQPVDTAIALINRGKARLELSDYGGAIADFTVAIDSGQLKGTYLVSAYMNRGIAYENVRNGDHYAVENYSEIIARDPENIEAYERRRQAHLRLDNTLDAESDLRRARQLRANKGADASADKDATALNYLPREGLFKGNKLEWLFGFLIVLLYAHNRFNTPKTVTTSTTRLRFHVTALSYYLTTALVFILISSLLTSSPQFIKVLGLGDNEMAQQLLGISGPLLGALILTSLMPHSPALAQLDKTILEFFRKIGQIPVLAAVMSAQLRKMGVDLPSVSFRKMQRQPVDVRLEIENFVQRKLVGVRKEDLSFERDESPRYQLTVIVWLMLEVRSWAAVPGYASVLKQMSTEHELINSRFEKLVQVGTRYMNRSRELAAAKDGSDLKFAVDECGRRFQEHYDALFANLCEMIARAILRCELTSHDRQHRLSQIGFNLQISSFSLDHVVGMVGMIFIILLTGMSAIGSQVDLLGPKHIMMTATMVAVIYGVSLGAAILPKFSWSFADSRRIQRRPYFAYLLSGVIAVCAAFLVALTFKSIQFFDFYMALADFKYTYPWFMLAFALAVTTAYLADNYSVPRGPRPYWVQVRKSVERLVERKNGGDESKTSLWLRLLRGTAKRLGRSRSSAPLWLPLVEGVVCAAVLGSVSLLVHDMLTNIPGYAMARGTAPPPLERVLVLNTTIGLLIGLLIPHWHRRSLGANDLQTSESTLSDNYVGTVNELVRSVSVLEPMNDEEIAKIAENATVQLYPPGARIVADGTETGAMYVLMSGVARADKRLKRGRHEEVGRFEAGNCFGEHAFLNGSPIQADVIAETGCRVVSINKQLFASILQSRPSLVDDFSRKMAFLRLRSEALAARSNGDSATKQMHDYATEIGDTMRRGFVSD